MKSHIKVGSIFLLMIVLASAANTSAQSGPMGSLNGTVRDATDAFLVGVTVTIRQVETNLTRIAVTNAEGRWNAPLLPVGTYEISFEMAGFNKLLVPGVQVEAAVPRTLDARMEVSGPTEITIVYSKASLATPTTSTAFRQLNSEELLEVPTSTRSFTHLLSAEAGISADLSPVSINGNGNISPSVNGTRTTSSSLQFNGVDATNISSNEGSLADNISPAPETLQEVKLQTSLYDASTGRSGGGNFQLITKSGSNAYSGSTYYYLQNEWFNANDFFYNKEGIEKPMARRHEGGFTIGGPIVKDKLFFFGGYQKSKAATTLVPTAQSITVLPEALRLIEGPRTAHNLAAAFKQLNPAFPLTAEQISPIAVKLLNIINPVTKDFLIPAPRANGSFAGRDQTVAGIVGGNPLIRQRNVQPALFDQDQFTFRLDSQVSARNRLSGTLFFANFPGMDPFPDPSSLASPMTLLRNDRNRTLSLSNVHTFRPNLLNEARLGIFVLNNTRSLSDEFLGLTNDSVGIPNPANFFDRSAATTRLGHYVFRNNMSNLSFGGPNDSFNRRYQRTYSLSDQINWVRGKHSLRLGIEFKRHEYDTNLPEEQATEFEKWENFTQFLSGLATEADTQFGITDKRFRMSDLSWFIADDWKLTGNLTLNLGLRWDWFGWPKEMDGRIGNFDFSAYGDTENPLAGFLVPNNVKNTGFAAIDATIAVTKRADNAHTLNGQDFNNYQPRFGFAYSPFSSNRFVVRGGYGIFFDRPSAAFMNTTFSNYPFLREIEVTYPSRKVPLDTAFSQQDPLFPFYAYLPNRLQYRRNGTYVIRDGTAVTKGADGTLNEIDLITGQPATGNIAETFEFRAIDRNLRTPYIQQWSLGAQFEITRDLLFEARYTGTKGTKLLQATAFNQGYDLNDPDTPDHIFRRLNAAYLAAYNAEVARTGNRLALRGPLNQGSSERSKGQGVAFGFYNPATGRAVDFNLSRPAASASDAVVIPFEARAPILGFNIPEAILLQSSANSIYNALQFSITQRVWKGLQFNASFTWSKSIDNNSSDPGSTAGGGKPDVPNTGFVVQGNQRNLSANRSVSDFDRPHRFSMSFVYALPAVRSNSRWFTGWKIGGFVQVQSGSPFTIFSSEPEITTPAQYLDLARGSGGLYRLGFGRPNLNGTLEQLRAQGADPTEQFFNSQVLTSPNGGFGNLGRNVLRGKGQRRIDFSLSKSTSLTEKSSLEFRWEIFNLFNHVNLSTPANDLQDSSDFGKVLNTMGGPRVMQFGLRFAF